MEKDMGRINAIVHQCLAEKRWDDAIRVVKENYDDETTRDLLLKTIEEKHRQQDVMAATNPNMTTCKYCGATVSKTAKSCPHCGGRFKKPVYKRWWFIVIVVVVVLGILGSLVGDKGEPNSPDVPNKPQSDVVDTPTPDEERVIPDPIVYTGSGDDVIEITPPNDLWAFRISGNSGAHHFSVTGYAENGEYNALFVNTTEPYSGITLDQSQTTTMLEIKAEGEWTVELISFGLLDVIYGGDTYTGTGDMVFLMYDYGKTADISGNADAHHFAVKAHNETTTDLLVNTTDPYEGTVLLRDKFFVVEVTAESPWTFTLSA